MDHSVSKSFLQDCQASRGFRAISSLLCALLAGPLAAAPVPTTTKPASYPAWWFESEVIPQKTQPPAATPSWPADYPAADDFAAANLGQLKQIATAAYDEMNTWVPGGAGAEVDALVKGWFQLDANGRFILDTQGKRQPLSATPIDNFTVANLGQLKAVAKPFYARLIAVHYSTAYPWATGTGTPDDFAVANLGQLKRLFSFDVGKDSDHDGIPDWWETLNGLDPTNTSDAGYASPIGGGSNRDQFQQGLTDSDGDGIPDWWEIRYGLNPLDPADAGQISQSGVLTNAQKYEGKLDPTIPDNDHDNKADDVDIDPLDPDLFQTRTPETSYAVIDLSELGFVSPVALNDSLQILDCPPSTVGPARLWSQGTFLPIPDPPDSPPNPWQRCLSNAGQIVAFGHNVDASKSVVDMWSPVGLSTLSYVGPATEGYTHRVDFPTALSISASGMVSGQSWGSGDKGMSGHPDNPFTSISYSNGVIWNATTGTPAVAGDPIVSISPEGEVSTQTGFTFFAPKDVNASGTVGWALDVRDSEGRTFAAVWPAENPYLSGELGSYAFSINNSTPPMIAGYAGPSSSHAVMWTRMDGYWKQKELGPYNPDTHTREIVLGQAWKVNDRCEIIGQFSGVYDSFWQNGHFVDVNTRISGTDYDIVYVYDINNNGAMLATAVRAEGDTYIPVLLLPVDVAIRKKGTSAAPADGLILKKGDVMEIALAPSWFAKDKQLASQIAWKYCQLKNDGTYTEWAEFGSQGTGTTFEYTTQGGIYRIKAVLSFGDQKVDILYARKRDEGGPGVTNGRSNYYGKGRKGQPDAIGVADTQMQIDMRQKAKAYLGSQFYAPENVVPAQYGFKQYGTTGGQIIRCNIFVAHRASEAGAIVPQINGLFGGYPPLANQWAGIEDCNYAEYRSNPVNFPIIPTNEIARWPLLEATTFPQPGYIIAHPQPDDAGHCAITDYDGVGIGAGTSGTVNKNYDEFYDGTSRYRQYVP